VLVTRDHVLSLLAVAALAALPRALPAQEAEDRTLLGGTPMRAIIDEASASGPCTTSSSCWRR
jgi:hypothetical protein